jgi:hypothetical protein
MAASYGCGKEVPGCASTTISLIKLEDVTLVRSFPLQEVCLKGIGGLEVECKAVEGL